MVFEALVVDILNKFLGQYVENLDTSQLKIGIWGGDVVLNNLLLKENALSDLNLPVQVSWGRLGKLVLKIPWKNLYSAPVIADIEELLLVVIPNTETNYDPEKEDRWQWEKKQAKLKEVEEAKKKELEKDLPKPDDTFVEKLVAQIIKNVQITIKNIHIRYEDKTTNPNFPFCIGATMSSLFVETISKNSIPCLENDDDQKSLLFVYKVISLEGLAIYWNPGCELLSKLPTNELVQSLLENIPTADFRPEGYKYIFGPIIASAYLRLNPKPESDGTNFSVPKVYVNVNMEEISLALTRKQFKDMMLLLQTLQRLSIAAQYSKFRPHNIPVIGHAKEWWHFAFNSVMEDIKRRRREWSWNHIKDHRCMCREYFESFKVKLTSKKVPTNVEQRIQNLEKILNVFNLVILRERAYVEVERDNLMAQTSKHSGGWFSGWFGYGQSKTDVTGSADDIVKKLEKAMTPNEKEKLYKAIGYQESAVPADYPVTFVATQLSFALKEIGIRIYDDKYDHTPLILSASLRQTKVDLSQRPAAAAMRLDAALGDFAVTGMAKNAKNLPEIVTSNCTESDNLVSVLYETKPLDDYCDQRLHVKAHPLKIIFDAETINRIRDIFQSADAETVSSLVAATAASLPTFQEITAMGLQYAIERRSRLELRVNIMSSYLLIPRDGIYEPNKQLIVIKLGKLSVNTEETKGSKDMSVRKMYQQGSCEKEIFTAFLSASYTTFKCKLTGVQILIRLPDEDWEKALEEKKSPLRLLEPTDLTVIFKKSLVTDDARIPKIIIEGALPSLSLNVSEERFVTLAGLLCSIPTEVADAEPNLTTVFAGSTWSIASVGAAIENKIWTNKKSKKVSEQEKNVDEFVQGIDLVGNFEMSELHINVLKSSEALSIDTGKVKNKIFSLQVVKLVVEATNKTFESDVVVKLGGIEFKQNYKGREVPVVSTRHMKEDMYLFTVEFVTFDRKIPDFFTKRGGVLSRLTVNMTPLDMVLNRDAILAQIAFLTAFQEQLESVKRGCAILPEVASVPKRMASIIEDEFKPLEKKVVSKGRKFRKKKDRVEVIDLMIEATLDEIDLKLELQDRPLAELSVKKGKVEMSKRKSYTQIDCKLRDILMLDLHSNTYYKKILTSLDEQTLSLQAIIYNSEFYVSSDAVDLSLKAEISRVRFVFLNRFIQNALDFSNAFQTEVDMLKEGASAAAERAKQNVMKAYENATKLSLDVKITAPLIVIPTNSLSMDVLAMDMGTLTLKNQFSELDYVYESGATSRPLLDIMQFQLQNLKCTRAVLDSKTMKPVMENLILDPVSFDLTIKRNLSLSWFKELPDIEMLARLKKIHVTLSHQDYSFAVRVSNENFSEAQVSTPAEVSRPSSKKSNKSRAEKYYTVVEESVNKDGGAVEAEEAPAVHTTVKFFFSMDSFIFNALLGGDQVNQKTSKSEKSGLAKFVLETIKLKGKLFSDGSISTSVLLLNCLLEDTRPGKEGRLTRLMERKTDSESNEIDDNLCPARSMMDVTFESKGADTFVDVRVFKFCLILSMDFLSKLSAFFSVDQATAAPPIPTQTKQTERKKSTAVPKAPKPYKVSDKKLKGTKEEAKHPPTFTVNLRLEKPDIIVVENMDSINTHALIFNTEVIMKYRVVVNRQIISGTLHDIQLYSCCFDPAKRRQTMAQVVKPFTISLAGSTPEGQGLHLEICLTEIFIVVNPKTIELLNKCNTTLFSYSSDDLIPAEEIDYSDLWQMKKFNEDDYWFLRTEQAEDALEVLSHMSVTPTDQKPFLEELCLISVSSILVTVEGLSSRQAIPLLWLEMSFRGRASNWSSQLTIESTLSLQMQYYNNSLASWEPLIEPVEVLRDKKFDFIPWELNCNLIFSPEGGRVISESDFDEIQAPKISITLSCTEKLELTITKSCLEVLQNLSETFTSAVTHGTPSITADVPQFVFKNETGTLVEINLEQSLLNVHGIENKDYKNVQVEAGGEVELENKLGRFSHMSSMVVSSKKSLQDIPTCLYIKLPLLNDQVFQLPLNRTNKRYYPVPVNLPKTGQENWGLVSDVCILKNTNTITLRSILQVQNHFEEPIDIHYMTAQGNEVEYVGTVEGFGSLNIPLYAVHNKTKELFFSVQGYSLSILPFVWKDVQNELNFSIQLQCNPKNTEDKDPFFIRTVGEVEQIYYENTYRHTMASMLFNVHLQPTVEMMNCLPVEMVICWQGCAKEITLQPGNKFQIPHAEPGVSTIKIKIENYLENDWVCKEVIPANPPEFSVWSLMSQNGGVSTELNLGVHCATKRSSLILTVYCPFLMVNKTGHSLSYKFDDGSAAVYHRESYKDPIMFSPSVKKFFSKKKACLKVDKTEWSDKFPIDVAGSGGNVECEDNSYNRIYNVSVTITLTFNSLTRMVIFTPYYVFVNKTHFDIECQEIDVSAMNWVKIESGSCVPFWPRSQGKDKSIHLRPYKSSAITPDFNYESTDSCLLRLNDQHGGIFVDVQATNSGTFITFFPYETGQAPALIINHSKTTLRLCEKGTEQIMSLEPSKMFLFAWRKPQGERKITWTGDKNKEYVVNLKEDEAGQALVNSKTNESVRYVSFLDGTQRILLFTDDKSIGSLNRVNISDTEIQLQIHGIGISLLNNINQIELLYIGLVSSKIIWETKKTYGNRFKPVNIKDNIAIEQAYRRYQDLCETSLDADPVVVIDNKIQINFESMEMLHPQQRKLRRVFEPGLWAEYRTTEDTITVHAKINKIQIDNQLHDCIFPVVLSPVPPPKTVAASDGPKPFFELSILQSVAGQSRVRQYKYFKILIQEFNVKIDIGLLHHLWQFLSAEEVSDEDNKKYFMKDLEYAHQPLESHVSVISINEQKNFYDLVHFSPLKIHFSFSLAGNIETNMLPPALSVMLQSLGVTLTDLHDVVFRLSYFERKCVFLTNSQLQSEVISHYYLQTIRQAYVLLLGLDVIGNPYGLVIGIGKGVEAFFYEPVQGIIQGPADFAAGVALGCKSLFGSTVGGTAGAISRITGTLGKGLAVLSLDKEYQRQRMEQQNRRADNIPASMAQGGKGLVMGVYEGVTGVVMKPLSGAKEEGVGGFFKGVGKGMMGLVTRPVTGVVDFASTSLNAVKRATEQSAESQRLRPPRFFQDDKLVLPYKRHEATGNSILYDIDKRKYCNTDRYEYHTELKGKEILLLTDKRMIIAEYSDVFGTWQVHLALTWVDMPVIPQMHHKGIVISMPKKKGNVFGSNKETKILLVDRPELKDVLLSKMMELYEIEHKGHVSI